MLLIFVRLYVLFLAKPLTGKCLINVDIFIVITSRRFYSES